MTLFCFTIAEVQVSVSLMPPINDKSEVCLSLLLITHFYYLIYRKSIKLVAIDPNVDLGEIPPIFKWARHLVHHVECHSTMELVEQNQCRMTLDIEVESGYLQKMCCTPLEQKTV